MVIIHGYVRLLEGCSSFKSGQAKQWYENMGMGNRPPRNCFVFQPFHKAWPKILKKSVAHQTTYLLSINPFRKRQANPSCDISNLEISTPPTWTDLVWWEVEEQRWFGWWVLLSVLYSDYHHYFVIAIIVIMTVSDHDHHRNYYCCFDGSLFL